MRRHPLATLAPLLAFFLVEVTLAMGALARPQAWQLAAEGLGLLTLGALWWRLAPQGDARSLAWPAVLPVLLTGLVYHPPGWVQGFLFAVGAVALAVVAVRVIEERLAPGPALGVALALLSGVLVRYQVLEASDVRDARQQLLVELSDPWPSAGRATADGAPLVLISVDTLRWDHAVEMKSWARLVDAGAGWPRAMATASWTLPSMSSALTGLPAELHGAGAWPDRGYTTTDAPTVAEDLRAAGYATAAFVTNPFCSRDTGLDRGFGLFQHVYERAPHRLLLAGLPRGPQVEQAELIVDRAVAWLEGAPEQGFFLWVHLLDPHLPYRHLPPGDPLTGWQRGDVRGGRVLDEARREAVRAAYAHEVEVVDAQLERLLDALARWPDATIVFMADHGEELWDHGDVEHGHSHHGEVVDVALAVSGPGVAVAGMQGVASIQDVASTLRASAGLPHGGLDLRFGVPLDRIATAYGNKYDRVDKSARQGDWRVIQRGEATPEAYDLAADPQERFPDTLPITHPLRQALEDMEAGAGGVAADMNEEALRALGYLD